MPNSVVYLHSQTQRTGRFGYFCPYLFQCIGVFHACLSEFCKTLSLFMQPINAGKVVVPDNNTILFNGRVVEVVIERTRAPRTAQVACEFVPPFGVFACIPRLCGES